MGRDNKSLIDRDASTVRLICRRRFRPGLISDREQSLAS
jgi:hypothetical protein